MFEAVAVFELWVGESVASFDLGGGLIVEDHVHAGESGGGGVFFLAVEGDLEVGLVCDFEEEGAGATGGVVDSGAGGGGAILEADDFGHDAGDFGGGVELALTLAAFCGEVAHEVFVGVAEDVVAVGAIFGEVEGGILEDGDEVGEAIDLLFAVAELGCVVEVGHGGEAVGLSQGGDDVFVDSVADFGIAFEGNHVTEAGAGRDDDGGVGEVGVFIADVFDEEQDEDVIFVLAGIHAATEFVATGPEGAVEFGFFDGHWVRCIWFATDFDGGH